MSGDSVIAGPEVDMTELDPASPSPLAVDLNLNLGPSFALELALGGQDFEGPVVVSRQNWPRFEPSILAGGQEDEIPAVVGDEHLRLLNNVDQRLNSADDSLNQAHRRGGRSHIVGVAADHLVADGSIAAINATNSTNGIRIPEVYVDIQGHSDGEILSPSPLQASRNLRHMRNPRRPRQVLFTPVADLVERQASSDHGSSTEGRVLGVDETTASVTYSGNRNTGTPNISLEIALSNEPNQEDDKKGQSRSTGAHFECNICLEMATEPVVTCCGHLYCWPCLYQWLHLHSSQKECPVCKGFLSDAAITPIYGRGSGQDSEKLIGNTPPRPHAHRINAKRCWQDRFIHELSPVSASGRPEAQGERTEPEPSNTSELIMNRLRVAQRLQRENLDERLRLRLRQRMMGRRGGAFRSPSALGAAAQASSASPVQSSEQNYADSLLEHHLRRTDSTAAIDLEHMQRSFIFDIPLGRQPGDSDQSSGGGPGALLLGHVGPNAEEERPSPAGTDLVTAEHSANNDPQSVTPELPQASWRLWRRGANGASSSFDVEPGSLHSRKRRRLN